MPSRTQLASVCTIFLLATAIASAQSIASTGQNVSAGRDISYQIISDTTGEIQTPAAAFIVQQPAVGYWSNALPGSSWIAPDPVQTVAYRGVGYKGSDTYRMTFTLSASALGSMALRVSFLADDNLTLLLLNGNQVSAVNNSGNFSTPTVVNLTSGFLAGTNMLDFVVGSGFGPTGLDAVVTDISPPVISQGGIVPNAGTSSLIQSGSWVSIYGTNLAQTPAFWKGDFPTSLLGVSATIDSKPLFCGLLAHRKSIFRCQPIPSLDRSSLRSLLRTGAPPPSRPLANTRRSSAS
jgi:hypothetical protein